MVNAPRLFIPGPTEVHADVRAAMATPQIGHRTEEMRALIRRVVPGLRELFGTQGHVFLSTSSATPVMEASLRNLVKKRVLCLDCGAWSQKWGDMAAANGIAMDRLEVPWGSGHEPDAVAAALERGTYDAVTLVWSETSTGALNHLADLARTVRRFDDVLLLVDAVSALAAVPIEVDALGIDVCLAGTQKAMAMPPGFAVFSVSERAFARAETVAARGYSMDFLKFRASADKDETPSTPSTAHVFALEVALDRILDRGGAGLAGRYERHRTMARLCQDWAREHVRIFTDERFLSPSVTCVAADGMDVPAFLKRVKERGYAISNGYGKLKGSTFRIGHFGEHTVADVEALLAAMSAAL